MVACTERTIGLDLCATIFFCSFNYIKCFLNIWYEIETYVFNTFQKPTPGFWKEILINAKYSLAWQRKCLEKKFVFVHHKWRWNQWIGNDNNFNGKTDRQWIWIVIRMLLYLFKATQSFTITKWNKAKQQLLIATIMMMVLCKCQRKWKWFCFKKQTNNNKNNTI